ncbi:hypothetical protein AB0I28_35235 [Phytomonospora sp. NPDC050363]
MDDNERAARFYRGHGVAPDGKTAVLDFNGAAPPLVRYTLATG